jgi:site-specific DNA-methyltransferase (adenine-specific)
MELNKVYNMDCLEGMKGIADKSIDLILCDLPYQVTKE